MNETLKQIKEGLLTQNPILVLVLGTCPTLAVTTSLENGIGMGLAASAVLICSNVVISLLRRVIPDKIRIAAFVVIISAFVTAVDMLLKAYLPSLSASLGLFIPLIVVNCIILGRAEAYAAKHGVVRSAIDGITMGAGFTLALVVISAIREILGNGTVMGLALFPEGFQPAAIMVRAPGGFLTLGVVIAATQFIVRKIERKEAA